MKGKLANGRAKTRCEKRGLQHGGGGTPQVLKSPGFTLIELLVVVAIIRHSGGDAASSTVTRKAQSLLG